MSNTLKDTIIPYVPLVQTFYQSSELSCEAPKQKNKNVKLKSFTSAMCRFLSKVFEYWGAREAQNCFLWMFRRQSRPALTHRQRLNSKSKKSAEEQFKAAIPPNAVLHYNNCPQKYLLVSEKRLARLLDRLINVGQTLTFSSRRVRGVTVGELESEHGNAGTVWVPLPIES